MPRKSADAAFDQLADRIFQTVLEFDPIEATCMASHGPNDSMLPDRSEEGSERELLALQGLHRELGAFREKELSTDRVVDLRLAKGSINGKIQRIVRRPYWKRCPRCYIDDIVFGVYSLIICPNNPIDERAQAILGRLEAAPGHLELGKQNLENPSPIFTESAALSARGALSFFDGAVIEFINAVNDPALSAQLKSAAGKVRSAFAAFAEWLEGNLMPRSTGEFAIGRPTFERLLNEEHILNWSSDELIAAGQRVYQETLREMKRISAGIDSTRPWSKVVESLKSDHPGEDEILRRYRDEIDRAREFIQKKELVAVPENESIELVATPEFARPMNPHATYIGPGPFSAAQRGLLWITKIDPKLDEAHQDSHLKGHPRHGIAVTAVHKTYPGQHLQLVHANRLKGRKLRHLFRSSTFAGGWALYCEDLMHKQGFYKEDASRLLQLKDILWRACRVIIDVELQTGRMGFNEAVTFLVRKAHIERPNAVGEVRHYSAHPTEPMGHVAGRVQIEELLEDYRAMHGDQFDLRTFHDELLSHGTIPVELIRLEMGIPRRKPTTRGSRRHGASRSRSSRSFAGVVGRGG